jgi:NADH dehydrogenase (ubiquinone) 1 beta subcomplex subunit 8
VFSSTYGPALSKENAKTYSDPQVGDYPNLPFENLQTRSVHDQWDDRQGKANFGDVLHEEDEILNTWAPELTDVSMGEALRGLGTFLVVAGLGVGVLAYTSAEPHFVRREYPYDGLKEELGRGFAARTSDSET